MRVAFSYFQLSLNKFAFQKSKWVKISVIVKVASSREVRHTSVFRASLMGFPDGSEGKESACSTGVAEDAISIPASGISPEVGNCNPFQCQLQIGAYQEHWQQLKTKTFCHLHLWRLNPMLLQLLTINNPWGISGWNEALCAPGNLVGQVFR